MNRLTSTLILGFLLTVGILVALTVPRETLLGPSFILLVGVGLVFAFLYECVGVLRSLEMNREKQSWLPSPPPERTGISGNTPAGSDVDDLLDALTDPSVTVGHWRSTTKVTKIRQRVRSLSTPLLADATGLDESEVRRQRAIGSWTPNARASAFLATEKLDTSNDAVPRRSLRVRVGDWLAGATYERGLAAALEEIQHFAESGSETSEAHRQRVVRMQENAWRYRQAHADDGVDLRAAMADTGASLDELAVAVAAAEEAAGEDSERDEALTQPGRDDAANDHRATEPAARAATSASGGADR